MTSRALFGRLSVGADRYMEFHSQCPSLLAASEAKLAEANKLIFRLKDQNVALKRDYDALSKLYREAKTDINNLTAQVCNLKDALGYERIDI